MERSAYDEVVARLNARFATLKAGSPEMDLDLGPVINASQKKRVEGFFSQAAADSVGIVAEGQVAEGVPSAASMCRPASMAGAAHPCAGDAGGVRPGARRAALRQ